MAGFFSARELSGGQISEASKLPQCGKCRLGNKCITRRFPPYSRGRRKVLFLFSAPSLEEDRTGKHWQGEDGEMVVEILEDLGVKKLDVWHSHAVTCHPEDGKAEAYMVSCCRPMVIRTILELQPKVIVPVGIEALTSLLHGEWTRKIDEYARWVGYTWPSFKHQAWIAPIYTPSYIRRWKEDATLVRMWRRQIKAALALEKKPLEVESLESLERKVEIITNPRSAELRMRDLLHRRGELAFDYESTGLRPEAPGMKLWSISFCLDGEDTFSFRLKKGHYPTLRKVLTRKQLRKIASNAKFEDRWTKNKLGVRVRGWHWDTMLCAHLIDNRPKVTSVKFQAFVLCGVPGYDSEIHDYLTSDKPNSLNHIHLAPERDLLLYGGLDSLVEYMVCQKQKRLLPCK